MMIGEPSGTAGSPVLKCILDKNLSNVLIVVTRYFGGILLGTGGLARAYLQVAKESLENTTYIKKANGYEIKIELEYSKADKFKQYLSKNNINILSIEYLENTEIILEISEEKTELIIDKEIEKEFEILKHEVLKEKYITLQNQKTPIFKPKVI